MRLPQLPFVPAFRQIGLTVIAVSAWWIFADIRPLKEDLRQTNADLRAERAAHAQTRRELNVERFNAMTALEEALAAELRTRDLSRQLDEARAERGAEIDSITEIAERDFQDADPNWSDQRVPDRTGSVRMRQQCAIWRETTGTDHPDCGSETANVGGSSPGTETLPADSGRE
jgi:hypothetical protein